MFKVPLPRRQEQKPSGAFTAVVPSQSTALELLAGEFPSFLAPETSCKSMDIAHSLHISETRITSTHGEIVVTQTHTEVRCSFTFRSSVEGKK